MKRNEYMDLFDKVMETNVYEVVFGKNTIDLMLLGSDVKEFEPDEVTKFTYTEEEASSLIELIFNDGLKTFEYDDDFVINVATDDRKEALEVAYKAVDKYIENYGKE